MRTEEQINEEIGKLSEEHEVLRKKQCDIASQIEELRYELVHIQHGVVRGSIVLDKSGNQYAVTRMAFMFRKPWVYGVKKNKSGEFGKREVVLYSDWQLPTLP